MKLKLDDDGNVVVEDGKPVYEDSKGKSIPFDAPAAVAKIKEQAETLDDLEKSAGSEAKKLEKELAAWKRLGDIVEVRKAVKTVAGLASEDLDAAQLPGQLSELSAEREALAEQLREAQDALKAKQHEIENLALDTAFGNSKWIHENAIEAFAEQPHLLRKLLNENFKVEDGRIVAIDGKGKPLMTVEPESNAVRPAKFDEALEQLVSPAFRRSSKAKGSDNMQDEADRGEAGPKHIRSKADLKTPQEKAAYISKHGLEKFQSLPMGAAVQG